MKPGTSAAAEGAPRPAPHIAFDLSALSSLAPLLAAALVLVASDIALVIDDAGVIRHVERNPDTTLVSTGWVGMPWVDTVTRPNRRKIELLLHEAGLAGVSRRREVNHPNAAGRGPSVPMVYAVLRLGAAGPIVAAGRDLRPAAALQQRMADAQREVEREFSRLGRAAAAARRPGRSPAR